MDKGGFLVINNIIWLKDRLHACALGFERKVFLFFKIGEKDFHGYYYILLKILGEKVYSKMVLTNNSVFRKVEL
jgi:hypothetical protein